MTTSTESSTGPFASSLTSTFAPVTTKKNGTRIAETRAKSCSRSFRCGVSASTMPARNAPMIAASPTYAEATASARQMANDTRSGLSLSMGASSRLEDRRMT